MSFWARRGLFLSRLLTRLRKGASVAPPNLYIFRCLQHFRKWRDADSNRGHHDSQSFSKALRYAEKPRR
jgi:hypothetical protein